MNMLNGTAEQRNLNQKETKTMWSEGIVASPTTGNKYKYWVKHFEVGSEYGISEGRISKLTIKENDSGRIVYNFDRGLDVDYTDDEVRVVYNIILAKYN
jgi:hypothetical protein